MAVSFIGGGNRSTQRKALTCRKSVTNYCHIMLHRVHLSMRGIRTQNVSQRQCQNILRIVYITLRQYNLVYVKTVKTYCMPPRQINNNLNAMDDKLSTFNDNESELSFSGSLSSLDISYGHSQRYYFNLNFVMIDGVMFPWYLQSNKDTSIA